MARGDLTSKQATFVDAYLANGFNGTQAVLQAYDIKSENKADTASAMAVELLNKDHVALSIKKRLGTIQESLAMGLDETAALLRKWLQSKDIKRQEFAAKLLVNMAPLLQVDKSPNSTHNHLHLPKR